MCCGVVQADIPRSIVIIGITSVVLIVITFVVIVFVFIVVIIFIIIVFIDIVGTVHRSGSKNVILHQAKCNRGH